jgi:molecular chaperone DnaK
LSKDEIEKMRKDAELHAEEDKTRREEIETRNQLDTVVYQAEKTLKEHADKMSGDTKSKLESAIAEAREALKGSDAGAIKTASEKVNEAAQAAGAEIYKKTAEQRAGAQAGPQQQDAPGAAEGDRGKDEPVIDAEVVDEKKT